MENLHLIVGLGNPGSDYARTRHNIGFLVLERLGKQWGADWTFDKKFNAQLAKVERDGKRALLCQPQTYMNSSGTAVAPVAAYYQVPLNRLLVVVDDADLPLGELRLRPGGGSGGHHGLESIEQHLGTKEYPRLRVGIGRQNAAREIAGHVLGRFSSTETALADKVLTAAVDQVVTWFGAGIQKAMSQFNGVAVAADSGNEGKAK